MDVMDHDALVASIPFLHDLGARVRNLGEGRAELALRLEARHMNSWQSTHGGVVMTLLDAAMSFAGRSLYQDARAGVTVDMTTSFMRSSGATGDDVIAIGKANHRSTTLCFCEGELWCGGLLAAKSTATFKYLRRTDASPRLRGHSGEEPT